MDPKLPKESESVKPNHKYLQTWQPVVFEDYLYYASIQRQEEEVEKDSGPVAALVEPPVNSGTDLEADEKKKPWFSRVVELLANERTTEMPLAKHRSAELVPLPPMTPQQTERADASRALRLASWLSVFYLITTDILGPFNAPYAISQVGWVPGVVLYFFSKKKKKT
jgi:hypothetical protein